VDKITCPYCNDNNFGIRGSAIDLTTYLVAQCFKCQRDFFLIYINEELDMIDIPITKRLEDICSAYHNLLYNIFER
jgi:hypothetical protein